MEKTLPQLGPRLQMQRKKLNLTLDRLADLSGVSKSMLSQIERSMVNPTFATLWSLTRALGVELGDLIEESSSGFKQAGQIEFVPSNYMPAISSADGKCTLRILSPISSAGKLEWYDLSMAPGGVLDSQPHARGCHEHATVLEGKAEVCSGQSSQILSCGDTARYPADLHHAIINVDGGTTRMMLVVIGL